ncbi:MAG TPA: citrate synthase [Anaerolineae bacterium]
MVESRFVSAAQAAAELGIRHATLYAYVSRGLIRSEQTGSRRRERQYYREDVRKLKEAQEQRRHPARAAARALHWGAPVLDSQLTLIADGKLYYRGYDALELASGHSLEEVAALLWTGKLENSAALFRHARKVETEKRQANLSRVSEMPLIEKFQVALPVAALGYPAAYDFRPLPVAQTGSRILSLMTSIAAGSRFPRRTDIDIARALQDGWAPGNPRAGPLIRAALVLCADHELNVSSFTARCVASAGATPYAAITAALSALQGTRHGGETRKVEALVREIGKSANARRVLANRLMQGERLPGFGHVLYPDGDPRARLLVQLVKAAYPRSRHVRTGNAIITQAQDLTGEHPTIDFALVLLSHALSLPEDAPIGLFALGRSVGWIAHIIEQYQADELIRPRARYTGPLPGVSTQ